MKTVLLLVAIIGLLSCRDAGVHDALQRAEALMETDPHAARAVLDSIDPPPAPPVREGRLSPLRGSGKGVLALYALLRTQADYKCRVRLTSDSLPLIATNYYGTRRKTQRAALAQYYLGCTYSDMHRDLDAIDALLRATTLFPDTTNKYYANSLFELGILYSNHNMCDDAISVFSRYRPLSVCESDSTNIGYADYYLGRANLFIGNYFIADSLFQQVIHNTHCSETNQKDTYFQLAKLYFYERKDIIKATEYINTYLNFFKEERGRGAAILLKAEILSESNNPALASTFYHKAIENSTDIYARCTAYKGLADVSSYLEQPDTARYYLDKYSSLLDTIYSQSKQREIAEIKDMHIVELHDQQLQARHTRFLLLGGLFFVVVFSAFAITLLLNDRKRKNERLRFEQELRDIKQRHIDQNVIEEEPELEEEETSISESENDVSDIQTNTFIPPRLSIQQERIVLYRKEFADSRWKRFLEERKLDILSKKFMPLDEAEKFKEYLENLFADIFLDMVNDNSNVTRQDIEYCAMTMLGFSTAQISYCARVSLHSLHNRRYHIKDKLTSDWYTLVFRSPK